MPKRLTGINPLAYVGVEPTTPTQVVLEARAPTANDYQGFEIGDIWIVIGISQIFILTKKAAGLSTWTEVVTAGGGDDIESLIGDDLAHATPDAAGDVKLAGGTNINTSGSLPNTLTVNLDDNVTLVGDLNVGGDLTVTGDMPAIDDVTINDTLTVGGVTTISALGVGIVQTDAAGVLSSSNGANGEVLIGGGTNATWSTITQGSGIVVTNGANSIEISATSGDNDLIPGTIVKYDGTVSGSWLDCNGSAVSQTTYATLFSKIGHKYCYPTFTLQTDPFSGGAGTISCAAHNGLAGGDGLWVAGSSANEIETSTDGITWVSRTSPFPGVELITGVAHNGLSGADGLWVVIRGTTTDDSIGTSPDGITWTLQTSIWPSPYMSPNPRVAHNGLSGASGLWIAGWAGGAYYSSDGITWSQSSVVSGHLVNYDILYFPNNPTWVSVCTDSYNYGSIYGTTVNTPWWGLYKTSPSSPSGSNGEKIGGLALFKDKIYATLQGKTYSTLLVSENGLTFSAQNYLPSSGLETRNYPNSIRSSQTTLIVSYVSDGGIYKSNDGINFSEIASPFVRCTAISNGETVTIYNSNGYNTPDDVWLAKGGTSGYAVGTPAINTATEFYLPNKPGYIILY